MNRRGFFGLALGAAAAPLASSPAVPGARLIFPRRLFLRASVSALAPAGAIGGEQTLVLKCDLSGARAELKAWAKEIAALPLYVYRRPLSGEGLRTLAVESPEAEAALFQQEPQP